MQQILILLVACFVGYRVIKKVRNNFTWSKLRTGKLMTRIVLFSVIGILFMTQSGFSAISVVSDLLGILLGAALGIVGAKMTSYDHRGTELYFKANAWIGGIVTAMFMGRLAYRVYEMMQAGWSFPISAGGGEWASGLIYIMFGYYVVYYALLMKQGKQRAAGLSH